MNAEMNDECLTMMNRNQSKKQLEARLQQMTMMDNLLEQSKKDGLLKQI